MFETIIALFIKRYVARYIDINADQLSAQLLYKQQIIIENLVFNKTTLNEDIQKIYKLPIEIDAIHIGKIQCSLILTSLFFRSSSPAFIIKIEGVHIDIKSSVINDDIQTETDQENDVMKKRNQLNLSEQQLEKEFECFGQVKSSRWDIQRLLISFFEKLQIEINDIHIRHQPSELYTIGLTCTNIQISNHSSDDSMSRQIFQIINPALYIDINNRSVHSYILSPISAMEICILHNHFRSSQKEYRYEFECLLNDLNMKCTLEQVRVITDIIRSIQSSSLHRMLISDPNRPKTKVSKQTVKAWWQYITLSVLRTENFSSKLWFNQNLLTYRLHRLNLYQRLYRRYLDDKYLKTTNFSIEDERLMNEIEFEFDIKHLLIIRRTMFQRCMNEQVNEKQESSRWYTNYAKWLTTKVIDLWGRSTTTSDEINPILNENDRKLEEQVNTFIAETLEDEDLLETNCQNSFIFRLRFTLKSLQIDLLSSNNEHLFNFYLKNLSLLTEFRLRHQSMMINFSLEDFHLCDQQQIDIYSKIICSKQRTDQIPILEFLFEKKGKTKTIKQSIYSIHMRSCGFSIICCPTTLERLHQFCIPIFGSVPRSISSSLSNWKRIKTYAMRKLISIWEDLIPTSVNNSNKMIVAYLRNRYREKKKLYINVNMGAPKIIMPLSGQSALIADLGCVILSNNESDQPQLQENNNDDDDEDEFVTPDSSPLAIDEPLEEETNYYSMNVTPLDIEYSSYSLAVNDIQVSYSTNLSQIIEKFSIHFLIQHVSNQFWPLTNISGTLQKMNVHLDAQLIQTLCNSLPPWLTFLNNIAMKQQYQHNAWPTFNFRLDEFNVQLNDVCDIRIQNIDLSLTDTHQLHHLIFTLQTLTIFDCIQDNGNTNQCILKTDQISNVNESFIRLAIDFSTISETYENHSIVNIHADKLDFIVNPKTICTLVNFLLDSHLFSWKQSLIGGLNNQINQLQCRVNSNIRELNVFFIDNTSMELSTKVHLQNVLLNILLKPILNLQMTTNSIQILDYSSNLQQPTVTFNIDAGLSQNIGLYMLYTNALSIRITSFSCLYPVPIIASFRKILNYMTQNCHWFTTQQGLKRENLTTWLFSQLSRLTPTIDLETSKIILPVGITLQLDHIHINTNHNQPLDFEINFTQMNFIEPTNLSWRFLDNISLSLNFQISDTSIQIHSKMLSPLYVYLSQYRIKLIRQILSTSFISANSSLHQFNFHLQSPQITIIFQTDRNNELLTISEGIINQFQMLYALNYPNQKQIAFKFDSLVIKDRLLNVNQSLMDLTSNELIYKQHKQFSLNFGKIKIKFVKSTWIVLSEILAIIDYKPSEVPSKNKRSFEILFKADSISCLFQDNFVLFMNIDLQHFIFQIQRQVNQSISSLTIHSQIDFISIHDLSTMDQLFTERFRTTSTNAMVLSYTKEKNNETNISLGSQLSLRMPSIQYIHTQKFLTDLIDFYNRFRLNEEFYYRFRSFFSKSLPLHHTIRPLNGIIFNIEIDNISLILPEHVLKKPVLILQLSSMHLKNQFDFSDSSLITLQMKDIDFYSSLHEQTATAVRFSTYGFNHRHDEHSTMIREPFHLNIQMEQNLLNTSVKINLSSIDILFDLNHYQLIRNMFTHNLNNLFSYLNLFNQQTTTTTSTTNLVAIIEINHIGLEIFPVNIDLLSFNHRRSLSYASLDNLHLSFQQTTHENQVLHLLCSTMKLRDTRNQPEDILISSNAHQLEIHLVRNQLNNQCTITMNGIRFILSIDWLLQLNEFLNGLCQQSDLNFPNLPCDLCEIQIHLNQFEVILVSTTKDPYSSALVFSSTIDVNYQNRKQLIACSIMDLSFLTCQIGNIDGTRIPIIEPTDCSFTLLLTNDNVGEFNIPLLNIRLSYSDIYMIYSLINTTYKQISQAKTRKPLLTFCSSVFSPIIRSSCSSAKQLFSIKCLRLICEQICICLIDDCYGVNIPLLNINLKPFSIQTIENNDFNRRDKCQFQFNICYYNRFQSDFEPLIELSILEIILNRTLSTNSLFITAKDILNINFTKAMFKLYNTIKNNWLNDYKNLNTKKLDYRHVKPLDPYCFKNLLGIRMKFRTWLIYEQRFSSEENIVEHNQTLSFCFPNHSSQVRKRSNSIVTSLFQSNRRLSIAIDGWGTLQPISIDRVGTFFRLAIPANNDQFYKPILVLIDIAMTDSSIRLITIKSSIQIRNQLLSPIDIQLITQSNVVHEYCLEPNEIQSLPIQLCSTIKQIHLRASDFALDYCEKPIKWSKIEKESLLEENTKYYQSFLRTCSIDGKEAVYYVCLHSKQTCLLTYNNQSLSFCQLSIVPPLTICNLLPYQLNFEITSHPEKFQIDPYKFRREHTLNILEGLDILFTTDRYQMNKPLHLSSINDLYEMKSTHQRVIFYDNNQRELLVDIRTSCHIKHRLKILISVPYILLNKSGIPLIFKDPNSKIEAAGQSSEDETTVNNEPLLFSCENPNRNNSCVMRVGTGLHQHQDGRPQWSQKFDIEHGSTHRQLQVRSSRNSPDWNYFISVDVRLGNGLLKDINFIFLSARYVLCNQCSYDLLIAQRPLKDDNSTCLLVAKHTTIGYHWLRTDFEQLLCVRIVNDQSIHWSGGFQIDNVNVFHINMRYNNGNCLILLVEIIKKNGTFFIVFMDSNQMPIPFRISNHTDIPIQFYQTDIRDESTYLRSFIQAHESIDYTWDEPTLKPLLTCSIADGTKANYDLHKLGSGDHLNYYNYIYLVFQYTSPNENLMELSDIFDENLSQELVIEYTNNRFYLARRQENKRSQLWLMTNNGILVHVGSTSIQDSNKKKDFFDDLRQTSVLDIEDSNENNFHFKKLTIRRYDPKRISTQTWQFLENNYLCLNNTQFCIQVFDELKENSDVVLGPIIKYENSSPLPTMCIRSHSRYPGSGVLSVRVSADGPTNELGIDYKQSNDVSTRSVSSSSSSSNTYQLELAFPVGVGISLIRSMGYESEELMYLYINNLHIEYNDKDTERSIQATIDTLTISNQLLTTTKPCFLHANFPDDAPIPSALRLQINWQKYNKRFNLLHIIHSVNLNLNSITIQLDEVLLWKLIDFFDIEISSLSSFLLTKIGRNTNSNSDRRIIDRNFNDYETERMLSLLTSTHTTRFYFNKLYLSSLDLNLSIYCNHTKHFLSPHLLAIKRRSPFPLVPFENAQMHLKSYELNHTSNTSEFFLISLRTHYVSTCTRQAYKILGSADYLGNPLGLIHDVSDGVSCLVEQGNVSGLVKNVAHGVADSTSKVTSTISHGLGKLVPDKERQRQIAIDHQQHRRSSIGRVFRHGTAGLAAGFHGALTSIIKEPYKGVVEDGVPGLVKGFAKGLVGTVSKPVVGILDFTNEIAIAVKESSRSSNTSLNNRIRLPRCPCNALGLLQAYSLSDAQGYYLLYKINKGNLNERYISRLKLSSPEKQESTANNQQNIYAMVTTQRVILYRTDDNPDLFNFEIIESYDFNTSMNIYPIEFDYGSVYIQIHRHSESALYPCDKIGEATPFCREVQRAQELYQEEKLIYTATDDDENDEFDE